MMSNLENFENLKEPKFVGKLLTTEDLKIFKADYGFNLKQLSLNLELNDVYTNKLLQEEQKQQVLSPMLSILLKLYDRFPQLVQTNEKLIDFANNLIAKTQIKPKFLTICLGNSSGESHRDWFGSVNRRYPNPIVCKILMLLMQLEEKALPELFKAAKQEAIARNVNPFGTGSWYTQMGENYLIKEDLTFEQAQANFLNLRYSFKNQTAKLDFQLDSKQDLINNGLTYHDLEKFRTKKEYSLNIRQLSTLFGINKFTITKDLFLENYELLEPALAILLRIYQNNQFLLEKELLSLAYYWEHYFAPYKISQEQFVIMLGMSYRRVDDWMRGRSKPNATSLKIIKLISLIENGYRELFEIVKEEAIVRKTNPFRTGIWDEKVEEKNQVPQTWEVEDLVNIDFDLLPNILNNNTKRYMENKKNRLINNNQQD